MHTILAAEELRACAATADNAHVLGTYCCCPCTTSSQCTQTSGYTVAPTLLSKER